eukprot:TRINITY_DN21152_c0_g1_i1.p1 TRINITY_DN21152_c0_g1~~TRINITY_DN21152_c0_g1_i1.p1  ORF type:complete len:1171 (+),score=230.09 TRINITY_DN21152_c0_g1_i1:52-3564(+)
MPHPPAAGGGYGAMHRQGAAAAPPPAAPATHTAAALSAVRQRKDAHRHELTALHGMLEAAWRRRQEEGVEHASLRQARQADAARQKAADEKKQRQERVRRNEPAFHAALERDQQRQARRIEKICAQQRAARSLSSSRRAHSAQSTAAPAARSPVRNSSREPSGKGTCAPSPPAASGCSYDISAVSSIRPGSCGSVSPTRRGEAAPPVPNLVQQGRLVAEIAVRPSAGAAEAGVQVSGYVAKRKAADAQRYCPARRGASRPRAAAAATVDKGVGKGTIRNPGKRLYRGWEAMDAIKKEWVAGQRMYLEAKQHEGLTFKPAITAYADGIYTTPRRRKAHCRSASAPSEATADSGWATRPGNILAHISAEEEVCLSGVGTARPPPASPPAPKKAPPAAKPRRRRRGEPAAAPPGPFNVPGLLAFLHTAYPWTAGQQQCGKGTHQAQARSPSPRRTRSPSPAFPSGMSELSPLTPSEADRPRAAAPREKRRSRTGGGQPQPRVHERLLAQGEAASTRKEYARSAVGLTHARGGRSLTPPPQPVDVVEDDALQARERESYALRTHRLYVQREARECTFQPNAGRRRSASAGGASAHARLHADAADHRERKHLAAAAGDVSRTAQAKRSGSVRIGAPATDAWLQRLVYSKQSQEAVLDEVRRAMHGNGARSRSTPRAVLTTHLPMSQPPYSCGDGAEGDDDAQSQGHGEATSDDEGAPDPSSSPDDGAAADAAIEDPRVSPPRRDGRAPPRPRPQTRGNAPDPAEAPALRRLGQSLREAGVAGGAGTRPAGRARSTSRGVGGGGVVMKDQAVVMNGRHAGRLASTHEQLYREREYRDWVRRVNEQRPVIDAEVKHRLGRASLQIAEDVKRREVRRLFDEIQAAEPAATTAAPLAAGSASFRLLFAQEWRERDSGDTDIDSGSTSTASPDAPCHDEDIPGWAAEWLAACAARFGGSMVARDAVCAAAADMLDGERCAKVTGVVHRVYDRNAQGRSPHRVTVPLEAVRAHADGGDDFAAQLLQRLGGTGCTEFTFAELCRLAAGSKYGPVRRGRRGSPGAAPACPTPRAASGRMNANLHNKLHQDASEKRRRKASLQAAMAEALPKECTFRPRINPAPPRPALTDIASSCDVVGVTPPALPLPAPSPAAPVEPGAIDHHVLEACKVDILDRIRAMAPG